MNNISSSSSLYSHHPALPDKSNGARKRPRTPMLQIEQGPCKKIRKAVKLDTMPFDIMEKVCSYLTLPDWVRLGLASRQLLQTVEWQGVWRKLNRENQLNLLGSKPMTEFSEKVSADDPSALRACSDLYIEGNVVDKDFHRALAFLQKIRTNSQTKEEQANVDLEIALLKVRYSPDPDPYTPVLQHLHQIINDEELSQDVRLQASFLMARIYIYYSPSDPDDELFNMVDEAYIYFSETANIKNVDQAHEGAVLRILLMINDGPNAVWGQELIVELNEILKNENLPSRIRQEINLSLASLCEQGFFQHMTFGQAFDLLKQVVVDEASMPEVRMLAKYFAAKIGMELEISLNEVQELGSYLKEVSESSLIARKYTIPAGFMYARMITSNKINARMANDAFRKFKAVIDEPNTPAKVATEVKFYMANLGYMHDIEGYSDFEIYQHLVEVKDSVHLSNQYRWLARYFMVLMNIQEREGVLLHYEIVNELIQLGNEPNLPDAFKNNVERQLQSFLAFPMDDDI